jgi:diguanylate cyclase (GGDEF)-like protein
MSRASTHHAATSSRDLAAGLAEMGYSYRLAWYVSAALYGTGGLLVVVFYELDAALLPQSNFYLGCIAIGIAALCVISGRFLAESNPHQEWLAHARLIAGFAIYVTAAISLGGKFDAYGLFPLLIVLAPAFLYTWRRSLPYMLVALSSACAGLLLSHGVAQGAHVLITTFVLTLTTAAILVVKERARLLSLRNRELAHTDPLTGVANMRGFRERAAAELDGRVGEPRPYALFAIDLDNFKEVNDRFDHTLGDEVLCAVASGLRMQLDPADLVARRGGDEFAVLVINARGRDLEALANTIRRTIVESRRAVCPEVTPSAGVAYAIAWQGDPIGASLERVDEALRATKAAARNGDGGVRRARERAHLAVLGSAAAGPQLDERAAGLATEASNAQAHLRLASARSAFTTSNPLWGYAALLFALTAVAIAVVSLTGLLPALGAGAGGALGACLLVLAISCLWADRVRISARYLPIPWTASFCVIAAAIALAGSSGSALLDLLALFALYGCFMFRARTAAVYLAVALVCYGAFALVGGFAQGALRTVVAIVVVTVVGGLAAGMRHLTVRIARKHLELSELDALTGVANLRGLSGRLAAVLERGSQGRARPVIIAVDLDGFKQVNDLLSHSTGDRVLMAVARAISDCVSEEVLVARRGGDEFLVVLDDADPGYPELLMRRLERAIVAARSRICPELCATACVAAVAWQPGETASDLLHAADLALHARRTRSEGPRAGEEPTLRPATA